jgi:ectoine hydroxylase-related dioxygenase (phytanoyl-CoA dioxygenase family)
VVFRTRASRNVTMADEDLERALTDDGYVVVDDFATPAQLEELLAVYRRFDSGRDAGYYPSIMSADRGYKAAVHQAITALFWPSFERFLVDYRPLVGAFMVKHPGPDTQVSPHQDWAVIDEARFRSVNCWIPTSPITDEVGPMSFLPGSHRYLQGLRGSPTFPTQWAGINERIRDELMVEARVAPGQAIIYDNRVLHGTPPNRSGQTRVVAYINAIPVRARPLHYHRDPAGTVRGYEVDPAFFHTFTIGDTPEGEVFTTIADYDIAPLAFEDLVELHRRDRSSR